MKGDDGFESNNMRTNVKVVASSYSSEEDQSRLTQSHLPDWKKPWSSFITRCSTWHSLARVLYGIGVAPVVAQ
jgi:hypothetical protein